MTPREFQLKLDGFQEREAWKAIINVSAKREKRPTINKLLNRNNVVSIEEHKKRFKSAIELMGPDVIPVRPRRKAK